MLLRAVVSFFALSGYILPLMPLVLLSIMRPIVWIVPSLFCIWAIIQWCVLARAHSRSRLSPRVIFVYRFTAVTAATLSVVFEILFVAGVVGQTPIFTWLLGSQANDFFGPIILMALVAACVYTFMTVALHLRALRGAEKSITDEESGHAMSSQG